MNARVRHILASSLIVLAVVMFVAPGQTSAQPVIYVPVTSLSMSINHEKITPDDSLNITVNVTFDWSGYSSWTPQGQQNGSHNLTLNVKLPVAMFMISHVATGNVVVMITKNVSAIGEAYYNYTPRRPLQYGAYMVWLTVENRSAFAQFTIEPALMDLYNEMNAMQDQNAKALRRDAFIVNFGFPFVLIITALGVFGAYLRWQIPNATKQEAKYWFMSHMDQSKLDRILEDVRDMRRKGYFRRHNPTIFKNEQELLRLHKKRSALNKLAESVEGRLKGYESRMKVGNDFVNSLKKVSADLGEEMDAREIDVQKSLDALQVRAYEMNRKKVIDVGLGERDMAMSRFRRTVAERSEIRGGSE